MGYRKTKEPENRDAFLCQISLNIYVNNCNQIHLTLPNLIKPNLKFKKIKVNFELLT